MLGKKKPNFTLNLFILVVVVDKLMFLQFPKENYSIRNKNQKLLMIETEYFLSFRRWL